MEKIITYNLKTTNDSSDNFYQDLSAFTNVILKEANVSLIHYVCDYYLFVEQKQTEALRSREEYLLELITTGIFWRNYIHKAEATAHLSKVIIKKLYDLRKTSAPVKPIADKIRGFMAYELLNPQKNSLIENYTLSTYQNLLAWLSATGEFNEEVIRLKRWIQFYNTKMVSELEVIFRSTIAFSNKFNGFGKDLLGKYTENIPQFLANSLKEYAHREDYFFAGRRENEYFLNMFGAEIMNRKLRSDFERTHKKAVLLPTCMRTEPQGGCQAKSDGKELVCVQCNKNCNVGKIASKLSQEKVTSYLIPHSSDFSRFLVKWKNDRETGLVGVSCVLNLLTGGYEMKRLNIASQCVFLDYCGCKKHWDKEGLATNLNINKLTQLISSTKATEPIHIPVSNNTI